jgi:hypothetical protein
MGVPARVGRRADHDATGACGKTALHIVGEVDAAIDEATAVNKEIARRTGLKIGTCVDAHRYRTAASLDRQSPCANGLITPSTADPKRLPFQSLRVRPSHFPFGCRHQPKFHEHSGGGNKEADLRW